MESYVFKIAYAARLQIYKYKGHEESGLYTPTFVSERGQYIYNETLFLKNVDKKIIQCDLF